MLLLCSHPISLSVALSGPLATGLVGIIIMGPVPFSENIWQGGNAIREVLLDELLVFLVPKLLSVFRTGPFSNVTTPLAANGTCAPGHRKIQEVAQMTIDILKYLGQEWVQSRWLGENISQHQPPSVISVYIHLAHPVSMDFLLGLSLHNKFSLYSGFRRQTS